VGVDITTETTIARPIGIVAGYSANPDHATEWYANIRAVRWITEPPLATGSQVAFVARFLGRTLDYTYEIVEHVPGVRLTMRTAEGPFPMETTYTWTAIDDESTRMSLRNRGEPSGFAALVRPVMAAAMRRANRNDLARLASILEAGSA
jgi:hypothetical protein